MVWNQHVSIYCLDIEIQKRHVPGYFYRSQLNFVISSAQLAKELKADFKKRREGGTHGREFELLDSINRDKAFHVRLTCGIEHFREYWIAKVKKVDLYGQHGEIVKSFEANVTPLQ